MVQTEKQIIDGLKDGKYAPVYLLTGEEEYYIDKISTFMENNLVAAEQCDFDRHVLYGRDTTMKNVVSIAKQFPMMSPIQLVLVKEAQDIDTRQWDILATYLKNPASSTVLVLCYRNAKLDKRSAAYKAIDKVGIVFEHKRLYENELPEWILHHTTNNGRKITLRAAQMISSYVGANLSKINNELLKLYSHVGTGETITEGAVEKVVGISKDYNIFELQDAIGKRDVVSCNRMLKYFAANPKSLPLQLLLANLYAYFIKLMIYSQATDKKTTTIAELLGIKTYFVKDYASAAKNYSMAKLAACIGYLHTTDLRSKGIGAGSTTSESELIKELIFKILH